MKRSPHLELTHFLVIFFFRSPLSQGGSKSTTYEAFWFCDSILSDKNCDIPLPFCKKGIFFGLHTEKVFVKPPYQHIKNFPVKSRLAATRTFTTLAGMLFLRELLYANLDKITLPTFFVYTKILELRPTISMSCLQLSTQKSCARMKNRGDLKVIVDLLNFLEKKLHFQFLPEIIKISKLQHTPNESLSANYRPPNIQLSSMFFWLS